MWYYYRDDVEYGPIDRKAMEYLYQEGIIHANTEIRRSTWKASKQLGKAKPFKDMPIPAQEAPVSAVPFPVEKLKILTAKPPEPGIKYILSLTSCIFILLAILLIILLIAYAMSSSSFVMILVIVLLAVLSCAGGAAFAWAWKQEKFKEVQDYKNKLQAYQNKLEAHKEKLLAFQKKQAQLQEKVLASHVDAVQKLYVVNEKKVQHQSHALAERYLSETVDWLAKKMTTNNFVKVKTELITAINSCRAIGYEISEDDETSLIQSLKDRYELLVRAEAEREEQARIRAQIREEQQREREIQKKIEEAENQEKIIQAALEKALQQTHDEHSAEVERLREELRIAQEAAERTKSQAQLTRAGYIYVISNIGSFGEGVYKIGMTRRLEPMDRVKELGDASVPFAFDVHMMISCDDAPTLENTLHKEFHHHRVNKINPRKEFFRTDIEAIRQCVIKHHGEVDYVADAEALEYFQSLEMNDEDATFIERIVESSEHPKTAS